jgi:hypothetical protein
LTEGTSSELIAGVSAGIDIGGSATVSVFARATGSANLSDFAASFGVSADHSVVWASANFTTGESIGIADLIAIAVPRPAKQRTANHNILFILDPKAPRRA